MVVDKEFFFNISKDISGVSFFVCCSMCFVVFLMRRDISVAL